MEAQAVASVQGGLPPPGGRSPGKEMALGETPELQALFQSLMASLMGSLMVAPSAAPLPTAKAAEATSTETGGMVLAAPTTQDGTLAWMAKSAPILNQGGDPLAATQGDPGKNATSAFATLLSDPKAVAAQTQTAAMLAENADAATPTHGTAQAAVAQTGMPLTVDQSALQMATTAQASSAQGEKGTDERLRPQVEVTTAQPTTTPSGMAPTATHNTVEVTNATNRSEQATPVQQIAERVQVTLNEGENSATIRLQPEELGGVRIRLQVQDGQLHLSIQAEKSQTGRMLDQQLGDLRQSLESGGIKVGDLTVLAGSRSHTTASESMSREAAQAIKTFGMEMGGNSTQHQQQQQHAAFAGQGNNPQRDHLPQYGQPTTANGEVAIGSVSMDRANAADAWKWLSAPRGVDYYA